MMAALVTKIVHVELYVANIAQAVSFIIVVLLALHTKLYLVKAKF